jgi:hypothetical protein
MQNIWNEYYKNLFSTKSTDIIKTATQSTMMLSVSAPIKSDDDDNEEKSVNSISSAPSKLVKITTTKTSSNETPKSTKIPAWEMEKPLAAKKNPKIQEVVESTPKPLFYKKASLQTVKSVKTTTKGVIYKVKIQCFLKKPLQPLLIAAYQLNFYVAKHIFFHRALQKDPECIIQRNIKPNFDIMVLIVLMP